MNNKPLYEDIFNLLDFAERLVPLVDNDEDDRNNYFMTLIYIEDVIDSYGRSMVNRSSIEAGVDSEKNTELRNEANQRLKALRDNISEFTKKYDFNSTLESHAHDLVKTWSKD